MAMEYNITRKIYTSEQCQNSKHDAIAIFSKPDYILLILTRNQLPSIVSEGKEAGRSHGDGTRSKPVGQFPSSVAILTTAICRNLLMARRVSFRRFPAGEPPFPETRLAIGQNHAPQFKLTSMSCMNHAIIKTYTSNSGIFSVCGNQHQGVTYQSLHH